MPAKQSERLTCGARRVDVDGGAGHVEVRPVLPGDGFGRGLLHFVFEALGLSTLALVGEDEDRHLLLKQIWQDLLHGVLQLWRKHHKGCRQM